MDRNEVRDRAMNEVEKYEIKRTGNVPEDTHRKKCGYDFCSEDRKIEVKGRTGTDNFIQLNDENINAMEKNSDFWLYIVHFDKAEKADKLIILERNRLTKEIDPLIKRRRIHPRRQIEVKFWAEDHNELNKK